MLFHRCLLEEVYCDECRTWNHRICLKLDQQEYVQLSKSDELFKCPTCDDRFIASLPDFQCNDGLCQAKFGELAGEEIREVIDNTYDEVVQWNSNLFKVPSGKAGRDFLDEMVKTINLFNCGSNLASVAITRGGGTSSNLGGPLLNFHLQCSLGGASRHLARTRSRVHFRLTI